MMCTHGFALVWDYTGSDRTVIGVRGAFSKIPKHSSWNLLFPSSVQLSIRSIKKKKNLFEILLLFSGYVCVRVKQGWERKGRRWRGKSRKSDAPESTVQVAERGGWRTFTSPRHFPPLVGWWQHLLATELGELLVLLLLCISGAFFMLRGPPEVSRCVPGAESEQRCSVWALASLPPYQSSSDSGYCRPGRLGRHTPLSPSPLGVRLS